jgi:hypothetical protein
VTAGCASILDQNWRIKNSHLIDGKLVFRLEASLSSGGTSVPVPAKQSRFQMDDYGDLHEQILHTEAHIEELTDIIERCRKIILISKAAIAAGGTLILAIIIGAVRFDPTVPIGSLAAVIGGTVVFGSNTIAGSTPCAEPRRRRGRLRVGPHMPGPRCFETHRSVIGEPGPHQVTVAVCPLRPRKRTIDRRDEHVRFVPCVDGSELARLFFAFAGWSVQHYGRRWARAISRKEIMERRAGGAAITPA